MQDVLEGKHYNFPKQEEQVLQLWQEIDAFKEQLRRTEGKKPYVFYDGPPFATGLPHYGHLLAGTLKVGIIWLNTPQIYDPGAAFLACLAMACCGQHLVSIERRNGSFPVET